jgi:hypothetical protein
MSNQTISHSGIKSLGSMLKDFAGSSRTICMAAPRGHGIFRITTPHSPPISSVSRIWIPARCSRRARHSIPMVRTPVRTACETYTDLELEQLMGVLPAASNHAIPEPFRVLMEEPSPIVDFYPEDWALDLNGKKWASTGYEYC